MSGTCFNCKTETSGGLFCPKCLQVRTKPRPEQAPAPQEVSEEQGS